MITQSNAMPESLHDSQGIAPAVMSPTRPMYWSVGRELSENRSIYLAPLAAAGTALLGFLISMIGLPHRVGGLSALHPAHQRESIALPYDIAAGVMMATMILVTVFYCADALYGERRDRSILLWKSLPVSDLTTVLAKANIPFVVLPLLTFAITIALQFIMLLLNSAVLLASGMNVAMLWTQLSVIQMWLLLRYNLFTAHTLWPAPVYCWLTAGFRLGTPRNITLGGITHNRDRRCRKACLPNFAFRCFGGDSIHRRHAIGRLHAARYIPYGSSDTHHPCWIPEHAGPMDRAGNRCGSPRRSGPATPLSRTDLIGMQLVKGPHKGRQLVECILNRFTDIPSFFCFGAGWIRA